MTNILLGLILTFMAFRVGKSVMMNFGDGLEPVFIFTGLALLLLIGPMLKWYVLGMTQSGFEIRKKQAIELIPFFLMFVMSLFITKDLMKNGSWVIIVLSTALIFIYLHFAFYIYVSWSIVKKLKSSITEEIRTKSQNAILDWLQFLIMGFVVIWVVYVLNIVEDAVPYIVGPIMYSAAIYFLSYKAFQLKIVDIDGSSFIVENDNTLLFDRIHTLIFEEKRYLESDISLVEISKLIGKSTQKTSLAINEYARKNFNDYINYYRIQSAKSLLSNNENEKFTISSIAFDVGFGSVSSFNTAFKKFEGITPSVYRKSYI